MDLLTALIIDLVVIAVLFEVARRANLPYPALFVLGGLALGFIPGLPSITLEPDLVLVVFLPPLLFVAAFQTPLRDLRRNLGPIARLAIALVIFTTVVVAAVAQTWFRAWAGRPHSRWERSSRRQTHSPPRRCSDDWAYPGPRSR